MTPLKNKRYKEAVEVFNHSALPYQNKFMDLTNYHKGFDVFSSSINNPNPSILELACGPGNITQYLLKQQPTYKILATDLAPNMLDLAKKNNPNALVQLLDCRNLKSLNQAFDGIICGFGLPYLTKEDAIQLIEDASETLKQNGVLYISTMEDDYSKSEYKSSSDGANRIYIHYHEANYLIKAIEMCGMRIIDIHRIDYLETDASITKDLVIVARKAKV